MDKCFCIQIVKLPPADAAKLADQLPIVDISEDCKNRKVNIQTILDFIEKRFGLVPGGLNPQLPPVLIPTPIPQPSPTPIPVPSSTPDYIPPFIGGQCNIRYVVMLASTHVYNGQLQQEQDSTVVVWGPIGGTRVIYPSNSSYNRQIYAGDGETPPTQSWQITSGGSGNEGEAGKYTSKIINITPYNPNQIDNCGNVTASLSPSPTPTPVPTPIPTPIPQPVPTPEYTPPFYGGQCDCIVYSVYGKIQFGSNNSPQNFGVAVRGPVTGTTVFQTADGGYTAAIVCRGPYNQTCKSYPQNVFVGASGAGHEAPAISITSVVRDDGEPDNCGNPTPIESPAPTSTSAKQYTVTQSSVYAGLQGTYANLTDLNSFTGAGTDKGAFVQATFNEPVTVTKVRLGGGNLPNWGPVAMYLNGRRVEYSTDNTNWLLAFTPSGITDTGVDQFKQFILQQPITAQYWRISLGPVYDYLAVTEFSFE